MKTFVIFFVLIIVNQLIIAQNTLKGKIIDKATNENLVGASVYATELNKGTFTDKNGNFSITGFKKGEFNIQVSYVGYQTIIEKINFSSKDTVLDIQMEKAVIDVNEVVISGAYTTSQDENPQEIDIIKKSEMQQTGASTIMDVISKVPGVSAITTGPLNSRPVIRGLSCSSFHRRTTGSCEPYYWKYYRFRLFKQCRIYGWC